MTQKRKQYTAEEKVGILRKHLLEIVLVPDLCEEYGWPCPILAEPRLK